MSPLSSCYARLSPPIFILFFFNDTATTEIYTLSLHDALPISSAPLRLVIDDVDRDHPVVSDRSIKAEVGGGVVLRSRSEEHTSELQSHLNIVCRLLLEKKKNDRQDRCS